MCGGQYSTANLIQFEEIMLDRLGWAPYRPTSCEMHNHLRSYLDEISVESNSEADCSASFASLAKLLKDTEFNRKAAIFIQIALLGKVVR